MDRLNEEHTLLAAARWKARLQAADCTDAERREFEVWRRAHQSHARAVALADRVSDTIDSLNLIDPRFQALMDEALQDRRARRDNSRRWALPAALVAGLACVIVSLRFVPDGSEPQVLSYDADAHRRRTVELADGSTVTLDVCARTTVATTEARRDIQLLTGRAVFDVAHDRTRPFVVSSADFRTTALGTRFQVDLQRKRVIVTLAEGSVAVDRDLPGRDLEERLVPGEQLSIDLGTTAHVKSVIDPLVATSWSQGRLAFRSTPLSAALDEMNRYSDKKVRLGDPTLAGMPVAGNFIAGDTDAVVTALTALLPLRVVVSGNNELILFRRYDEPPF